MKFTHIAAVTCIALGAVTTQGFAQNRPAPTGQVPKAYSGQQGSAHTGYQPKPTGQIAPAAAGQSPANLPRQAGAPQVQNLGFEPSRGDITAEGQVPKVNSNQDPRTFPERYQSTTTTPVEQTITVQGGQVLPAQNGQPGTYPVQTTETSVTTQTNTTTVPGAQTNTQQAPNRQPAQTGQQVPMNGQPQQKSPSQLSTQPQSATPAAPAAAPGAPKRMDP
ncbi:hypothetical protein [Dyadobacter sp. CY343]|uniref:hypothetical protein n=1 Tax=Dyadobacter sp. CY343 TaxID=2907299 RepID=UPI001F2CD7B6|nr:hypothetical protein [Dyadobacter sp. CY343]MCE7060585.1 hypothetical protein [Dyadobacter sp. CY343]